MAHSAVPAKPAVRPVAAPAPRPPAQGTWTTPQAQPTYAPPPPPVAAKPGFGKTRSPGLTIFLIIITFSIYGYVWYYKNNKELTTVSGKKVAAGLFILAAIGVGIAGAVTQFVVYGPVIPPGNVISIIFNLLSLVVFIAGAYKMAENLHAAQLARGISGMGVIPMTLLLGLPLVNIVGIPVVQSHINRVWT